VRISIERAASFLRRPRCVLKQGVLVDEDFVKVASTDILIIDNVAVAIASFW